MRRARRRLEEVWLYYGWADSVVWFGSPIPYAESGLSEALIADLEAWRADLNRLTTASAGASEELTRVRAGADDLARRLAGEIGPLFSVAVPRGRRTYRVRHRGPSTNPSAAAVFARLREREVEWSEAVGRALADGAPLQWNPSPEPDKS